MENNGNVYQTENRLLLENEKNEFKKICNKAGFMTLIAGITFFAVSTLLLLLFRKALYLLPDLPKNIDSLPDDIYGGFVNMFSIGVLGLIFIRLNKDKSAEQLPTDKISKSLVLSLVVIGFTVCMMSNYLTDMFLTNTYNLGIDLYHKSSSLPRESLVEILFYILSVAVVPAVSEEILFRGALLYTLRKHSDGFAVLISSLIFGLFHGNFVQFPFAFIVGLVLSWIVVYTNSVIPAIIVHFANNLFSTICDLLSKNAGFSANDLIMVNLIINFMIIALAIISLVLAKKLSEKDRTFLSLNNHKGEMDNKDLRHIFFKSPGIIAAVVFLGIQTITNHIF